MKASAKQVFTAELIDLSLEEARLIRDAVLFVADFDPEELSELELEITKDQVVLAKKLAPLLQAQFDPRNWRE